VKVAGIWLTAPRYPGSTTWVVNNTLGDEGSPLTEFFNGTTDRMLFGVGGASDGFIESSTLTKTASTPSCAAPPTSSCVTAPHLLGGTSGIVIDNQGEPTFTFRRWPQAPSMDRIATSRADLRLPTAR
jgi:hypothetical protein